MELVVRAESALVMITGDWVCLIFPAIAQREFVLMILLGSIRQTKLDPTINMLNAPTEESAIVTAVNVIASLAMKGKAASVLLAQMIALVMVAAHTFRICLTRLCPKTMSTVTSSRRKLRLLHTTSGMDPRPEVACAILSMETLTAQRECANMALMSWTRDWI